MSKGLFFTAFFLVAALAIGIMVLGVGMKGTEPPPTPEPSEKQQAMSWAAQQGNTLFLYNVPDAKGYALCKGIKYLVSLRAGKRRSIDLTADEGANLSLCKQDIENPSVYSKVKDLSGTSPGDFLIWGVDGMLNWDRYTN